MADNKDGSIAARCISFARQGMIAFSYDMVGYNDTFFANYGDVPPEQYYLRHRRFATNEASLLWNISLMGLQTWNSIRALDFLASLPDTDRKRLACTGESGGGTQTFMLGAIDGRLSVQAPIVMVSHSMQGGCLCENAPGLRVEYSNMEIATCPAPRPQILVAASGDWTKDTLTVEGPSIQGIYRLFGSQDRFHFVRFNFDHNYNQTSREAVYGWFNKWLLGNSSFASVPEAAYTKEPDQELRVFPEGKLPAGAKSDSELISYLEDIFTRQLDSLFPSNKRGLQKFKQTMSPAWKHTLQLTSPGNILSSTKTVADTGDSMAVTDYLLSPAGSKTTSLKVRLFAPKKTGFSRLVVCADPEPRGTENSFASSLVQRGVAGLVIDEYSGTATADQFANFYSVYNRTKAQQRVADLERACNFARTELKAAEVILCGQKAAGLWALLAAPAADAVVADCNNLNVADESKLLAPDIFFPGLLRTRSFETAAVLAAPNRLLLHNTGSQFRTSDIERAYKGIGARTSLQIKPAVIETGEILDWLSNPTAKRR
jgi:dienelactone hydrolase